MHIKLFLHKTINIYKTDTQKQVLLHNPGVFQFTVDMEFSFEFLYDSDVCMIAIYKYYIVYLFTNMSQIYR